MTNETPTAHDPGCRCMTCANGLRNRFFKGKMMKAPEFEMEQRYGIDRRRMLTRAISGWGVVRGLAVIGAGSGDSSRPDARAFSVSPGLALDPHGREILLAAKSVLASDNTFLIGGNCELKSLDRLEPGEYVLAIHYAERLLGDTPLQDDCCGTRTGKNYVCETALFSLRKREGDAPCVCGEEDCPKGVRCRDHQHPCGMRSRHASLCEWIATTEEPACPERPCHWREYDVWVNGRVDLACLCITKRAEDCWPPLGHVCDDCGPRRIVKNNDLLYHLIRGCDLTRIEALSWGEWHRNPAPVKWEAFIEMFKHGAEDGVIQTGFTVHFTRPVMADTVKAECFTLQLATGKGWLHTRCVEIAEVRTSHHPEDPAGTTRRATLCVEKDWVEDLTCHGSRVRKQGAVVQIEVRGDFILDCHGQPVDANACGFALQGRGDAVSPSGNGTPGGVLISVFTVAKE